MLLPNDNLTNLSFASSLCGVSALVTEHFSQSKAPEPTCWVLQRVGSLSWGGLLSRPQKTA